MEQSLQYIEIGKYFQNGRASDFTVLSFYDPERQDIDFIEWYEWYSRLTNSLRFANSPKHLFALIPKVYSGEKVLEYWFVQLQQKQEPSPPNRLYYQVRLTRLSNATISNYYRNKVLLFSQLATSHGGTKGNPYYSLKDYSRVEGRVPIQPPSLYSVDFGHIFPETGTAIAAVLSTQIANTHGHAILTYDGKSPEPIARLMIIEQAQIALWYKGGITFSTDYIENYNLTVQFLSQGGFRGAIHKLEFNLREKKQIDLDTMVSIIHPRETHFSVDEDGLLAHVKQLRILFLAYKDLYSKLSASYFFQVRDSSEIEWALDRLDRIHNYLLRISQLINIERINPAFYDMDSEIRHLISGLTQRDLGLFFRELENHYNAFSSKIRDEINYKTREIENEMMRAHRSRDFARTNSLSRLMIDSPLGNKDLLRGMFNDITQFLGKHTQAPITRYGNISYPDRVLKGHEFGIKMELGLAPSSDQSPRINIPKGTPKSKLSVDVLISFDEGDFENDGDFVKNVPIDPDQATAPVLFTLRALREGKKVVKLDFFHQGYYQGQTIASIMIQQPRTSQLVTRRTKKVTSTSDVSINVFDTTSTTSPDLTIYLRRTGADYEYRLYSNQARLGVELKNAIGKIDIQALDPQSYMQKIYEEINEKINFPVDQEVFFEDLNSIGTQLYDKLFSSELKSLWWETIYGEVKSILIVSDETWIPWELIKPYRRMEDGQIEEDDFLCEKYQLSRWLQGGASLPYQIEFKDLKLIISAAMKDLDGKTEKLKDFQSQRLKVEEIPASLDKLFPLLSTGGFNALHFGCHSVYDKDNPDYSYLELDNDEKLQPRHISGSKASFGEKHPLVFLNACASGRSAPSLTGVGGWVGQFLGVGVSAFIGAIWDIENNSATPFARYFYENLLDGKTIGEAAQIARLKIKKVGDPSWLSYIVYANPNSTTMTENTTMQIRQAKELLNTLEGVMQ